MPRIAHSISASYRREWTGLLFGYQPQRFQSGQQSLFHNLFATFRDIASQVDLASRVNGLGWRTSTSKQRNARSAFLTVGAAFFLAELGDKTMLATITLATQHGWVGVWVGSTLSMVAADALAIVIGRQLGTRLPERAVRYGAAALFVIFGGWLLVDALTP